jgi:hypothetical protein
MVTVLVSDQQGIDIARLQPQAFKPAIHFFQAKAAIDQQPDDPIAIGALHQQGVTLAATAQTAKTHAGLLELFVQQSDYFACSLSIVLVGQSLAILVQHIYG